LAASAARRLKCRRARLISGTSTRCLNIGGIKGATSGERSTSAGNTLDVLVTKREQPGDLQTVCSHKSRVVVDITDVAITLENCCPIPNIGRAGIRITAPRTSHQRTRRPERALQRFKSPWSCPAPHPLNPSTRTSVRPRHLLKAPDYRKPCVSGFSTWREVELAATLGCKVRPTPVSWLHSAALGKVNVTMPYVVLPLRLAQTVRVNICAITRMIR